MQNIQQWKHQHRHIECFVFAHEKQLMLKTLDETDEEILPRKENFPSDDTFADYVFWLTKIFHH